MILEYFDCRTENAIHTYTTHDINNGIKTATSFSIVYTFPFCRFFLFVWFHLHLCAAVAIGTTNTVVSGWYILNKHTNVSTTAHFRTHTYFCRWRKKERKKWRGAKETEQTKEEEANEYRSNLYACALCICVLMVVRRISSFISSYLIEVLRSVRIHSIGNCVSVYIDKNKNQSDTTYSQWIAAQWFQTHYADTCTS